MEATYTDYKVSRLGKQDVLLFQQLIQLFHEVFEMQSDEKADESYLLKLLNDSKFVALAVFNENEIAGGLTAYEMPMYYKEYSEMYLYDIAIKHEFQRKGLAGQLLTVLKEYCANNNIKTMFVEAMDADKHAVEFYRSTGGVEERVRHFNYYPGK